MKKMEKAIKYLLDTNPFYAHYFLNSIIEYRDSIGTAAAVQTPTAQKLIFSPKYIETQSTEQLGGLIEHEVLHLLFGHHRQAKNSAYKHHLANLAFDVSINQHIKILPEGGVNITRLEQELGEKLETYQHWLYYYGKMAENPEAFDKYKTLDNHDGCLDESEVSEGEAAVLQKSELAKAIKAAKGNVPSVISKLFDNMTTPPELPWGQLLRNFMAKAISKKTKSTRTKINRRFGIDQPGKKRTKTMNLGVCVDSSGSVSDDQYKQFLTEIMGIIKVCDVVNFVEADCVVQNVQTIKSAKDFDFTRKGCGGTAYGPAIKKCVELKCDAIVYFGDFDASDTPENPNVPMLWVGVGSSEPPAKFGSVVRLK